jgi:hypothetical protein
MRFYSRLLLALKRSQMAGLCCQTEIGGHVQGFARQRMRA